MYPVEPLESFLGRLVPGIDQDWQGASAEEMAAIEAIAGRPLPAFYRWFLARMGRDMGALSYATIDFSAARVLACYRDEIEAPDPRHLLIGYQNDPVVPMHIWYDLDRPNRGDARVLSREIGDPYSQPDFETFREMLAWKALLNFKIQVQPSRCEGEIHARGEGMHAPLTAAMTALGFECPVPVGSFCGIFDRPDAAMICNVTPRDDVETVLFFDLGGMEPGALRSILGVLATQASLDVKIDSWG